MPDIDAMLLLSEQVALGPNEELQSMWVVLHHLGQPLVECMVEGLGIGQGETNEEDIGVGVGKCSEAFVLVLASGVPEP